MKSSFENNIKLIKDGFESSDSKAPDFVWNKLDKQLYIDRVWQKLKIRLDKTQKLRIRTRIFSFSATILLLALFISYYSLTNKSFQTIKTSNNNINYEPFAQDKKRETYNYKLEQTKESHNPEKQLTLKSSILPDSIKTNSGEVLNSPENLINDSIVLFRLYLNKSKSEESKPSTDESHIMHDSFIYLNPKDEQLLNIGDNLDNIKMIDYQLYSDSTFVYSNFNSHKNEIGIIYNLNNTILINNDFIESNREGSTVSILPAIASSFGMVYNYTFSPIGAISFECFIISNQNQFINLYHDGKYYKKTIELDYSKIAVLFQKDFGFKSTNLQTNYFIKAGGYFSIMTKNNIYLTRNNENFNLTTLNIDKKDCGIKISFGREMEINNFIIGSGFQSEYGLMNIFLGNETEPSYFNRTNNFCFGLFLTLKYNF